MQLLKPASVRQYAKQIYQGVDFQSNVDRGNLARAHFVNDVCSAIKADLLEMFPEKVFSLPGKGSFQGSVKFVLQDKPGVQPIQLCCVVRPRAAKVQGQKRQLVDSSSEEEVASRSGEKGNSPPRRRGPLERSPSPLLPCQGNFFLIIGCYNRQNDYPVFVLWMLEWVRKLLPA